MLRCCLLFIALAGLPAVDYLSAKDALALAFPASGTVERLNVQPTVEQMKQVVERARSTARGKLGEIWVGHSGGALDGIAIIDHVIGRTEYITYLCVIGADSKVRRLEVMSYREPYGGEIRDARFLAQFAGIGPDDPLRRDRPVTNIAGATMSVDALCERVRFLLDFHAVVLRPAATTLAASKPAPSPSAAPGPVERSGAIGSSALTVVIRDGGPAAAAAADKALAEAERLDAVLNRWRSESELARLNTEGSAIISADLANALDLVDSIWRSTKGGFDPTVAPVILLWQAAAQADRRPDDAALAAARATIGFDRVTRDRASGRVTLAPGSVLDLGGIAKGLMLDRLGDQLRRDLPATARIELRFGDSSQLVLGPADTSVDIALRHPAEPEQVLQRIRLTAGHGLGCASASGRVFTVAGERLSHLIDPRTGQPTDLRRAAWVIAPQAGVADGLDTALCLLDAPEALQLAAAHHVEVLLWDGVRLHASPGWPVVAP